MSLPHTAADKQKPWWMKPHWWLAIATVGFTVYFGLFNVYRHLNLFSAQYDLGNMDQVLWQSLHGRWFSMVDAQTATLISRAAIHADFSLLVYLPFYALWPHPLTLAVAQVIAVASGAWPLFWFARRYLSAWSALLFALAYFTYPALHWATTFDVHAVVLATPLILWFVWSAATRRWWWYAVFAVGILLSKEETGAALAILGLYIAWWRKPRWIGLSTFAAGVAWTALMLFVVIPGARATPGHFALGYYGEYGESMGEVVKNILLNPRSVLRHLFDTDGRNYLVDLLRPLGFLSVIGWPFLLAAAPEVIINLISTNHGQQTIFFQYTSVITPLIFLGAVLGWRWIRGWIKLRKVVSTIGVALVAVNLLNTFQNALLPWTRHHRDVANVLRPSPYQADVRRLERQIPRHRRVATTNNIAPHFTARDSAWAFPRRLDLADDLIILTGGNFEVEPRAEIDRLVAELLTDPAWSLAFRHDQLYHFQRVPGSNDD